jgi:hypothetical protein
MAIRLSLAARNASLNLVNDMVNAGPTFGQARLYTGTQPASADTAPSGTLLASFVLEDPAFASATAGSIVLDADPDINATAVASGTAGYLRFVDSTGVAVFDGSVGTSGTDFIVNTTSIVSGQTVTLVAAQLNFPI